MFRKNEKNLTVKKYPIVCIVPETKDHINLLQIEIPSLYRLKTSGNLWFFMFFRWLERDHWPEMG